MVQSIVMFESFLQRGKHLFHFAIALASVEISDGEYAPLRYATSQATVSADEDRYTALYEYTAQVIQLLDSAVC